MRESHFQKQVIQLARLYSWRVAHFHQAPAPNGGWRTPIAADGKGFPDLVLVRDRVIFAELKARKGRLRPEQTIWLDSLIEAGQECYVWYEDDLDVIKEVLSGCSGRPALTPAA